MPAVHKVFRLTRSVNMNRLGAALLGEVTDPPIMALYVFGANPATSSPNAGKIVAGLKRDDLFTVVHELFMTDTPNTRTSSCRPRRNWSRPTCTRPTATRS